MLSSIRKKWFEGLLALLLTSCGGPHLSVQTDFLTEESLASYYVGTPDPLLYCGAVGQRMLVMWAFPKSYLQCQDMYILIEMRYKNRKQESLRLNNLRAKGTYIYSLMNDDYFDTGGIRTFKVQLYAGETLIEEWRHQLWVDLITINDDLKK